MHFISTEYLTRDAAKKIQFGNVNAEGEIYFGSYLESLTLNGEENSVFTLGGVNCTNNNPALKTIADIIFKPPKMHSEGIRAK